MTTAVRTAGARRTTARRWAAASAGHNSTTVQHANRKTRSRLGITNTSAWQGADSQATQVPAAEPCPLRVAFLRVLRREQVLSPSGVRIRKRAWRLPQAPP